MTVLLPQAIGVRRAREMSYTGNFLGAEDALQFGLVNHVVPHGELLPFTRALAADIAGNEADAVRQIRATYAAIAMTTTRGRRKLATRGRGIARCSAPRASPNGGPRSNAAAEVSDPLAGCRPRAAAGSGAPSARRQTRGGRRSGAGRARGDGGRARRVAASKRAHPGRRLRPVPPPGPEPLRRRHRRRRRRQPVLRPQLERTIQPDTPIHGAGRCCCLRSCTSGDSTTTGSSWSRSPSSASGWCCSTASCADARPCDRPRCHGGGRHGPPACSPTRTSCSAEFPAAVGCPVHLVVRPHPCRPD